MVDEEGVRYSRDSTVMLDKDWGYNGRNEEEKHEEYRKNSGFAMFENPVRHLESCWLAHPREIMFRLTSADTAMTRMLSLAFMASRSMNMAETVSYLSCWVLRSRRIK